MVTEPGRVNPSPEKILQGDPGTVVGLTALPPTQGLQAWAGGRLSSVPEVLLPASGLCLTRQVPSWDGRVSRALESSHGPQSQCPLPTSTASPTSRSLHSEGCGEATQPSLGPPMPSPSTHRHRAVVMVSLLKVQGCRQWLICTFQPARQPRRT